LSKCECLPCLSNHCCHFISHPCTYIHIPLLFFLTVAQLLIPLVHRSSHICLERRRNCPCKVYDLPLLLQLETSYCQMCRCQCLCCILPVLSLSQVYIHIICTAHHFTQFQHFYTKAFGFFVMLFENDSPYVQHINLIHNYMFSWLKFAAVSKQSRVSHFPQSVIVTVIPPWLVHIVTKMQESHYVKKHDISVCWYKALFCSWPVTCLCPWYHVQFVLLWAKISPLIQSHLQVVSICHHCQVCLTTDCSI